MILEVKNLVKYYKNIKAVDNISFSIKEGTCFGLLGQNGAGKTTTVEIMEDIITQSSGEILFRGRPRGPSFKEEIGIQFQHTELLAFLTVEETLETFAKLYKNSLDVKKIMEICKLEKIKKQLNNKISGGQKQRLLLGLALLNDPDLMFLDEPSTGLDPQARQYMWHIIKKAGKQGKTIILTTHYMEEAEVLCDEIIIMDYGRIIARGSPEQLITQYCKDTDKNSQNLETVFLNITGRNLRE